MQICECNYPIVRESDNAKREKYCERCGHWWMPEHGSKPERVQMDDKQVNFRSERVKVGRNDPCPCGSGLKFKKRCLK